MEANPSLWFYFINASFVVKCVMLLLLAASIASWSIIIQRGTTLKKIRQLVNDFEQNFWSGSDLSTFYQEVKAGKPEGLATIFCAGFTEFIELRAKASVPIAQLQDNVRRAMRVAQTRELDKLEHHLSFLASVGSTSPYIGLFGTVWGIMTAFHALGGVQQATIAMVAPGIAEALIATAMGLFAAIPAVLAYNRYTNQVYRLQSQFNNFQEEFCNLLQHQVSATHD